MLRPMLRQFGIAAFAVALAGAPTAITLAAAKIVLPGGYAGSNHPKACTLDRNGVGSHECNANGGAQPDRR